MPRSRSSSSAPRAAEPSAARIEPTAGPQAADSPMERALSAPRIVIEAIQPAVDGGRHPAKAVVGQPVQLEATVFMDGHDVLAVQAVLVHESSGARRVHPLQSLGNDRWQAHITADQTGRYRYELLAWLDRWGTYRAELGKKYKAGVVTALELAEGRELVQAAATRADAAMRTQLVELEAELDHATVAQACDLLLTQTVAALMAPLDERRFLAQSAPLWIDVERTAAGFASWYELFPRSATDDPARHGTFRDVIARLPAIRDMGFDVLYFPPIHPIGRAHRKGRNNSLVAGPDDPGSPYAIGSAEGGHDAVHPQLGTLEDFRALVMAAAEHGLEIALDFAVQCSQDHPWLKAHPGWFSWRADGSIRYAENPPKKYEDIVNVDFYGPDARPALWLALRDAVQHWVDAGVRIFRVDNPHTKPLPFWEWLIADIRARHPETIFLAEAFTRPAMMRRLGEVGFTQSYTYFTWRNTKAELTEYLTQLNAAPLAQCYRPNFFVNTPDINPHFLQSSGRAGFLIRAALATMGSGLWGMVSGFELGEAAALPGKEEFLDSEKYEIRARSIADYARHPGNLVAEITQLNRIRRENPALQTQLGFRAYNAWNDQILYFGKATPDLGNFVLVAVSLDPHQAQEAHFELPLWEFGLGDDASLTGEDLMSGHRWQWHGKVQFMRIEPWTLPFGIWRVSRSGARAEEKTT